MNAANRNTLREITKTKSRFLSILLICAIGVGFFSGVRATAGIMRRSADDYYDEHELFDLRVVSTFGLTDDDLEEIRGVKGVDEAYASKYTDLSLHCGDHEFITRVYSKLPEEINTVDIYKGRAPEADDEVIVSCYSFHDQMKVGDTVTLDDPTKAEKFPLKRREYTIVGIYNTPMFISMTQRGSTNIGDGVIDALMIVPEEHFTQEPYTEIYIKSDEMTDMQSYSEKYTKLRDEISKRLKKLGEERSEIRYGEVLGPAQQEIADGEAELEKAKADGQKELDEAKQKLDDAKQQIEDGEKELEDGKAKIDEARPQIEDAQKEIDKGKAELDSAKAQLDSTKWQLDNGQAQLDKAKEELDKALEDLTAAEVEIAQKRTEINGGKVAVETAKVAIATAKSMTATYLERYETSKAAYNSAKTQLDQAERDLANAENQYGQNSPIVISYRAMLVTMRTGLRAAEAAMERTKTEMEENQTKLAEAEKTLAENEKQIAEGEPQLLEAEKKVAAGREKYQQGLAEYTQSAAQIAAGRVRYEAGLVQYNSGKTEYDTGYKEFSEKKEEFDKGVAEYEEGVQKLEDAKAQYEQGLIDYEDGKYEFETKIADAEKELSDARDKIAEAGNAQWYIFTRDDNSGYSEYDSNAERINRIAAIFPVFFLLVAGLVCLTTMSRMVEEQRTQTGTLKALGYGYGEIMGQYILYAVLASIPGVIVGLLLGLGIIPKIIFDCYKSMYAFTDITLRFRFDYLIGCAAAACICTGFSSFMACRIELASKPAELMRPRPPKNGKRILLERVTFLWNRFKFTTKVTFRNLFRYKSRVIMMIIGVGGCTALLLTGFGLRHSIVSIVDRQYTDVFGYDAVIAVDDEEADYDEIEKAVNDMGLVTESMYAMQKVDDVSANGKTYEVYLIAVDKNEDISRFFDIHNRVSGEKYELSDEGIVINEKLARLLDVKIGDSVKFDNSVKVTGIMENYTFNYVFMTKELFNKLNFDYECDENAKSGGPACSAKYLISY